MTEDPNRLDELRASARGWHGVQLAVLGFIGLCGVLEKGGGEGPRWLQITAGLLILLALALSCLATGLVASAAWPLYGGGQAGSSAAAAGPLDGAGASDAAEVARTGRRLRLGIVITFLAVALTALGATSSWWPSDGEQPADLVEVTSGSGLACGELREGRPGVLALRSAGQDVAFSLSDVFQVRPVAECR